MWSLICLYLLVATTGQVHGTELSVSAVNTLKSDDSLPCGKVRCVQEVNKSNNESIISLTLRKQLNGDVLLVEVSQQYPIYDSHNDNHSSHGTRHGRWASNKAEANVLLYDSQDCNNAEFVCDVIVLDKFGLQHVSSSSGAINGKLSDVTKNCEAQSDEQTPSLVSKVTRAADECYADITESLESKIDTLTTSILQIHKKQRLTTCPRSGSTTKRYQVVYPSDGSHPYLCDTSGGWIVIQRRINGKTNFYRNWNYYKRGFGEFTGNFWLGLDQIHKITFSKVHELWINMEFNGTKRYALYDSFNVWSEEEGYRLQIGRYQGNAGDSLMYHNLQKFSTHDRDNDLDKVSCAERNLGAWWYNQCVVTMWNKKWRIMSNLNGNWGWNRWKGPYWKTVSGSKFLSMTEMKIRPK